MATLVHMTEPISQPSWEISQDAFAPPPTRRVVRGWDREPVSARAPRLQGQKVWKKAGCKTKSIERIENDMADELEKDGAGARKKSRTLTSRENINDAMWAEEIPSDCAEDMRLTSNINDRVEKVDSSDVATTGNSKARIQNFPNHKDDASDVIEQASPMAVLQLVPRKRTNADHVITPKKGLRQTKFDHKGPELSVIEKTNIVTTKKTRLRKSLRKSMVISQSAGTSEAKTLREKRRFSSAEHLYKVEALSNNTPEVTMENTITRVLPPRTNPTRRSVTHAEQASNAEYHMQQDIELLSPNATSSITSRPTESTMSGEQVIPTKPIELPINGDTTKHDIKDPNPTPQLNATSKPEVSECLIKQISDSQGTELPTTSINIRENAEHVQAECLEGFRKDALEKGGDQITKVDENQQGLSDPPTSTITLQLVARQDTSQADEEPPVADTTSPANRGSTSSPESSDEIPQTEGMSSNIAIIYDHDDTDMLRNFLTRVKANKAAKKTPQRKRSLPHSPLRIPLGDLDNNASPSPLQLKKENGFDIAEPSPSKRKKKPSPLSQSEDEPEPRRSSRTKPPTKELPTAPSYIPVRRFGQDADTTVTLKRNEEKELAALTRFNTRKNKGNALPALEVLAKKSEEKDDPAMRQRLLKEVFEEKMERGRQEKEQKSREKKTVSWAEELAQFQTLSIAKSGEVKEDKGNEKTNVVQGAGDKKQGAMRVGVRSKTALGMVLNGTPAPKRKVRGHV